LGKNKVDEETRQDLRRKNLCFRFKEPWVPGHQCLGKGNVHLIEVRSDNSEEDKLERKQEEEPPNIDLEQLVTIATLIGVPTFFTIKIRGTI